MPHMVSLLTYIQMYMSIYVCTYIHSRGLNVDKIPEFKEVESFK